MSKIKDFVRTQMKIGIVLLVITCIVMPIHSLIVNIIKSDVQQNVVAKKIVTENKNNTKQVSIPKEEYIIIFPDEHYNKDENNKDMNIVRYADEHSNSQDEKEKLIDKFEMKSVALINGKYVIVDVDFHDKPAKEYAKKHAKTKQQYELMWRSFQLCYIMKKGI